MFITMRNKTKAFNLIKAAMITLLISFCLPFVGCSKTDEVEILIQKLKDEDPSVQTKAAKALGDIKDARAVEPLIAALKDNNWHVRLGVAKALGDIKDAHAVEPLIAALKDKESAVRREVVEALGEIKDARAVGPSIAALKDKDQNVRWWASVTLGKIGTPAVEPLIVTLKNDEDWNARWWATVALGKIGASAVEPLIVAIRDKVSYIREEAAKALGEIKDVRASETLITAFKQEDLEIVAGAYLFFIRKAEPGTETVLIEALNKNGTKEMAQDFSHCGNNRLEEAGRNWAKSRGYEIMSQHGGRGELKWGNSK